MLYHMLDPVKTQLNFSFNMSEYTNGTFGTKRENGSWSGQIGALLRGEIDMSVMDLTVNWDRAQVIDADILNA